MTQRLATVALLFPKEGSRKVNFKYLSCDVTFLVNIMVHTWSASINVCFQSSCCFCFPTYITHNRHHGYQPVIFDQRTKECKSYDFKIEKWQVFLVLFFFSMQVLLQGLAWPREDCDNDCSVDPKCHISGYPRQFIANGMCAETLGSAIQIWFGYLLK